MKLYKYIIILATALFAAGCAKDAPGAPDDVAGDVCELVVSIDAGSNSVKLPTRAGDDADQPWGEPYPEEPGTEMENRISNVHLYFVADDGSSFPLALNLIDQSNGRYHYKLTVNLSADFVNVKDGKYYLSGRLVAVANHPSGVQYADPFNIPAFDIENAIDNNMLPMWGVSSVSNLELISNNTVEAGTIKLLRAVSKITIFLDDEIKDLYNIVGIQPAVTPDGAFKTFGLCHPSGASTASSTDEIMIEGGFNPAEDESETKPTFYGYYTNRCYTYLAERPCGLVTAGPGVPERWIGKPHALKVTLRRKDRTEPAFFNYLYLCDYDAAGQPDFSKAFPALVRNHDYQYKISLADLEFKVSVAEWIFGGRLDLELE